MAQRFKKKGIIFLVRSASVAGAVAASLTIGHAQETIRAPIVPPDAPENILLPNAPGGEGYFISIFLPTLTRVVIGAAGGFALLFIIIGGIQILTAYGNDEKIAKAKKTITYAIVGLLVAILSYAIVSIISAINLSTAPGSSTPQ